MKLYQSIFLLTVLFFSTTCDEGAFENRSLVDLEVRGMYPEKGSVAPVNASVVATFNKPIDAGRFKSRMMDIAASGGERLKGEFHIQKNTVIFTPSLDFSMQVETKYTIEISDLVDVDGNVLKKASSFFVTGKKPDSIRPYPVKAKAEYNIITVYFNEPLLTCNRMLLRFII